MDFKTLIEDVRDFPKDGILYRDIQPLLENPHAFKIAVTNMKQLTNYVGVDYWVGIESRGFIFAAALAEQSYCGFKMIRKTGKLPNSNLEKIRYDLEYGSATIEMKPGKGNVILVDDVYATGGTMDAAEKLCISSGYNVIDKVCLVDIGIKKQHDVKCLISY